MARRAVSNEELATWKPRLERLAQTYRRRAEVDDLVQEGWIYVWRQLQRGVHPSQITDDKIRNRMKDWCKRLQAQEAGRNARLQDDEVW